MSRPLEPLRLVGFENLSAGVLRTRLLAARQEFWSGSCATDEEVRALHDPLFFHQLGGFGAVALTPEDDGAGYPADGTAPQGSGLGNVIVSAMARTARGTVTRDPAHQGTRFVLSLDA